jgi:heptosyltransferase-3
MDPLAELAGAASVLTQNVNSKVAPSFSSIAIEMARAVCRNWRIAPHLILVTFGFIRNYAVLSLKKVLCGSRPTVAIALLEHMGDIVAGEPVSRFARAQFPRGTICWVASRHYRELVKSFPPVDHVVTVRCMTGWLLLWSSRCIDTVWDLHTSERLCEGCRIVFRKPGSAGEITYRTYFNFGNLLTVNCLAAGIDPLDDAPVLSPRDNERATVDKLNLPERFVVIHCKSNEDCKDWARQKWEALASWIVFNLGFTVVEIGSAAHVITKSDGNMRSLCGKLRIMESAEVLRRAALFIGIDSGPAHLANAVGTPGVILLGQYQSFLSYTPYSGSYADGSGADLVRANGFAEDIPLDAVVEAVANRLRTLAVSTASS